MVGRRRMRSLCLVLAAMFALAPRAVEACSCVILPNACVRLVEPDAILFEATVDRVSPGPGDITDGDRLVSLRDVRPLVGRPVERIVTAGSSGACGYDFRPGERYLVDAYPRPDGTLAAGICGYTRPIDAAGALVRLLRSERPLVDGGAVIGRVVLGEGAHHSPPAAGATVTLQGPVTRTAVTDRDGSFVITALPPGRYEARVPAPSGTTLSLAAATVSLEGTAACEEVNLGLAERNTITGLVTDAEGRPLAGVFLTLQAWPDAAGHARGSFGYTTGADGRYAFEVAPGGYDLEVGGGWGRVEQGRADAPPRRMDGVELLEVAGGRTVERLPLRLRKLDPIPVDGRVQDSAGRPVAGARVAIMPADRRGVPVPEGGVVTGSAGQFWLDLYDGLRYRVRVARAGRVLLDAEFVAGAEPLVLTIPPQ
jgi:hypothetical protein